MDFDDGKRQHEQQSSKSSRSASPDSEAGSPAYSETYHPLQRTPPPSRPGPPQSPPVPTKPVAPVTSEPAGPLPLMPCAVCGRTFVPSSLSKHVKICEKMMIKKRKTFDSSRQRREGTDLEQYLPKNFGLPENSPFIEKSPPTVVKPTPKPKVQSVRSAMTKPTADLQKCPHCNRAFGVRAFERHVEWCADKAKILPAAPAQPPPHIADAKQRLNARTQYKAPPVRGRRSSQSREKSSNSRSASVESTRGSSPPPTREYGDCKRGRTRASESISSNDCHEDNSPHVPVIRNSRNTLNSSSGDANVRARQARLAKDISNSRKQQNQANPIQRNTTPAFNENDTKKLNVRINIKKRQQLEKLEEIANKHKEREEQIQTEISKTVVSKSQIPIKNQEKVKRYNRKYKEHQNLKESKHQERPKDMYNNSEIGERKSSIDVRKRNKETTMSLDSLDEPVLDVNRNKNCQSVGINTELLCPCIPCVIHENSDQIYKTKKTNINKKDNKKAFTGEKVELLYKNSKMNDLCDTESTEIFTSNPSTEITTKIYIAPVQNNMPTKDINKIVKHNSESVDCDHSDTQNCQNDMCSQFQDERVTQRCDNYEQDLSEEHYEDSLKDNDDYNNRSLIDCRHGSGDTYTKFTEDTADLEEFFKVTDKMLYEQEQIKFETVKLESDVTTLHTPLTDSLETINTGALLSDDHSKYPGNQFSDTLEDLKNDFKDLMHEATSGLSNKTKVTQILEENNMQKNVCDMEHITIYEVKQSKLYTVKEEDNNSLKLPMIDDIKRNLPKNKMEISNIYKANRKSKMLGQQARTNRNYQTFIIKNREDTEEICDDDAPPLKLPRIEKTRIDDNYDPFASAAKQMKELMSSDKNNPKKVPNISRDYNRTLPNLKQAKEKSLTLSHPRQENIKLMKDTINKTYQKTPSLQRMKSFGSTNNDNTCSFGGRCSSFRLNKNDKKPTQKLNSTFTKSSKENISISDRTQINRSNSMSRSFSSYSNSCYSTPKLKDKIPKLSQSMHHGFQRTTTKQPLKLEKVTKVTEKSDAVTLHSIFNFDKNSLMTDSNYIDPRLINENDNLPINVNTLLNNPDIISSMESLLTTENLPAKFESFSTVKNNNNHETSMTESLSNIDEKNNNKNDVLSPRISDLSSQYNKIMSSLEQSITSKTSGRDDNSLCEDFDLEEFMTSFDEEIHKQKSANKRTYSSTTRIVAHSNICSDDRRSDTKVVNSPKIVNSRSNGMIPVNKSTSLIFSHNNITGDKILPSPVKRSTSLLDSIQKKTAAKAENSKSRQNVDQLEEDIMQSLKDFDTFYESQRNDSGPQSRELNCNNRSMYNDTIKRNTRKKNDVKTNKSSNASNGNCTPNGKSSNDSAYSSLNRISPSKLTLCNTKESNGVTSLERIPASSDTSGTGRDDARSISSDEFLAMERSTELNGQVPPPELFKQAPAKTADKQASRRSSQTSPTWRSRHELSSSGSESSLFRTKKEVAAAPRLSRFCHECGSKFPVDTAKFCIECGVKRLAV